MKRIELIPPFAPKLTYEQMVYKFNEVIEGLNSLLPPTPKALYIVHQIVWYSEKNVFATVNKVEVNKYNNVVYTITYVNEGEVITKENVSENFLRESKVREVGPEAVKQTVYVTGRKGREVTVLNKFTNEKKHFMNVSDASLYMGRSVSYLSGCKTKGIYSNDKYRWMFGPSQADKENTEVNEKFSFDNK